MMHKEVCKESNPSKDEFKILRKVQRHDLFYLSVMEALYIREENPILNTKDEFKGRMLRIKIQPLEKFYPLQILKWTE